MPLYCAGLTQGSLQMEIGFNGKPQCGGLKFLVLDFHKKKLNLKFAVTALKKNVISQVFLHCKALI